jgi:putative acetyltransferase
MNERVIVREETPNDADAILPIHRAAFPTDAEARLVDLLRQRGKATVSLVAVAGGAVVGHVLFSPVTVGATEHSSAALGLAPVAILPAHQGRGIGSALIRAGLGACRARGVGFVVVLGDPRYYARFGFEAASEHGLPNEYGAGAEFMVQELRPQVLPVPGGLVRYAPEFAELGV